MDACPDAHILSFLLVSKGARHDTVVSCIEKGVRYLNECNAISSSDVILLVVPCKTTEPI